MKAHLFSICLIVQLFAPMLRAADDPAKLENELMAHAQELFDAAATGNQEPWKKYFADDCLFFDEKGRNFTKAELVADIRPLPNGYSGKITVGKPKSLIHGDTAILSYDLDETEVIFGQNLRARYHVTDTWLHRNNNWQIAASQAFRYYEDPAIGTIDSTKLQRFVGTYQLAPGQTRTVSFDDGKLFVERNGKREELFPESSDIFFRKGVEGRILFQAGQQGSIDALIDRRNNEDVVWKRVK